MIVEIISEDLQCPLTVQLFEAHGSFRHFKNVAGTLVKDSQKMVCTKFAVKLYEGTSVTSCTVLCDDKI